ncbi:substrate-binding periplasmic protein [Shewanella woodyi]|uniref:substrate-binding periplasmic protein n=1 Tax=Shewanella woodyi TaxID=60961 RepID=UPI00374824FC
MISSATHSAPLNAKPLTYFVIAHQAEPFQIVDDTGQHQGIISDIITSILRGSRTKVIHKTYPFKRMLFMMEKENQNHWISYGSPAWKHSDGVEIQNNRLSQHPLFYVSHQLITDKDTQLYFSKIEDLFGQTLITLKGFSYPGLDSYLIKGQIKHIQVGSHEHALKALKTGRGVAFVAMKNRALYTLKTLGLEIDEYAFIDFSSVISSYPIHLSYSEGLPEPLIQQIETKIVELNSSGKITDIIRRYQM